LRTWLFDAQISWQGSYKDAEGVFYGRLSPKTYGTALRVRTAQAGNDMPPTGSSKTPSLLSQGDDDAKSAVVYIKVSDSGQSIVCEDDAGYLWQTSSRLYFRSPFSKTPSFCPHLACETYLRANPGSTYLTNVLFLSDASFVDTSLAFPHSLSNYVSAHTSSLDAFKAVLANLDRRANYQVPLAAVFYDSPEKQRFLTLHIYADVARFKWYNSKFGKRLAKCRLAKLLKEKNATG
jgi:hypothetical protein